MKPLQAEQFIYSFKNGEGYKVAKSPRVDEWLEMESYARLVLQRPKENTQIITQTVLDRENVVALSFIKLSEEDELNRRGVYNHTILVRIPDLIEHAKPIDLLTPHFVTELSEPVPHGRLKPIELGDNP